LLAKGHKYSHKVFHIHTLSVLHGVLVVGAAGGCQFTPTSKMHTRGIPGYGLLLRYVFKARVYWFWSRYPVGFSWGKLYHPTLVVSMEICALSQIKNAQTQPFHIAHLSWKCMVCIISSTGIVGTLPRFQVSCKILCIVFAYRKP